MKQDGEKTVEKGPAMITDTRAMSPGQLRDYLRGHLVDFVIPFWLKHAVDRERGGLYTCLADDGTLLGRNKYAWSQARGLWTFSALYNRIERRPEWLAVAEGLFRFLARCGRDENGYWVFLLDEEGAVLKGPESIVTDAFAILGLVEFHRATGSDECLEIALDTHRTVMERLARPGSYGTAPYPTPPGTRAHREPMQFSLAFHELAKVTGSARVKADSLEMSRLIVEEHYREDRRAVLEYVGLDGSPVDADYGRAMVPGHGIESAYFTILSGRENGRREMADRACRAMRWCLERGWDPEFGGIFLGIDCEGREPVYWKHADMKLWWVHAEALGGLMVAWEHCRQPWCLEWYRRVHEWSFTRFPVPGHGEWTQKLDRRGRKSDIVVALPVKDPFHLPRGLIMAIEALGRVG